MDEIETTKRQITKIKRKNKKNTRFCLQKECDFESKLSYYLWMKFTSNSMASFSVEKMFKFSCFVDKISK